MNGEKGKMATLYLYSNLNSVFDFIGRNFIGCFEAVPERTGTRTISFLTQKLIFVTHLKLNEQQRNLGLGIHPGVFSIVLSIMPKRYAKGKFPAILVGSNNGDYKFEFSDLKKYDENKHLGAFVIGEIPFSLIEEIIFMNEDELDAFNRPSLDYWYPENKFKVTDSKEFTESLPEDFLTKISEEELLKKAEAENRDVTKLVCGREKLRACLLNAVEATKKWLVNGYTVNIDSYLQKTFKLSKNDLTKIYIQNSNGLLPQKFKYESAIGKFAEETVELIPVGKRNDDDSKKDTIEDELYRFIFYTFIEMKATAKHNSQDFLQILQELNEKKLFTDESDIEILREDYRMLNGNSLLTVEQLMERNKKYEVLNAIFLVMKNPGNFSHFSQSLNSYHVDQLTARRAMVLWGALNGLNGVPGETTYKSCQSLWNYVDAVITSLTEVPILITMPMPVNDNNNEIIGLKPLCDKVIGLDDVFTYVSNPKNTLGDDVYKKAIELVREITDDITSEKYYSVVLDVNISRKAGTKVPKDQLIMLKQHLERLLSEQPYNNFDQKLFFKEWFKNKENFIKLYQKNEPYWINFYKQLMGGVKDEQL